MRKLALTIFIVTCGFSLQTRGQVVQPPGTYNELEDIKNLLNKKDQLNLDRLSALETAKLKNLLHSSKNSQPTDLEVLKVLGGSKTSSGSSVSSDHDLSYVRNSTLINHNAFTNPEYFGRVSEPKNREKIVDEETVWHMADSSNARFHEQISLTRVEQLVDFDVDYDREIDIWKAFRSKWKTNTRISMVGMTDDGIVLLKKIRRGYELVKEVKVGKVPYTIEVFEIYRNERLGVVIVSIPGEIVWLQTNADFTNIEEVWRWQVHKDVTFIHSYNYRGNDLLLLVNDGEKSTADIYEFNYDNKQFWIAQVIPLSSTSQSVGVLDVGDNFIICVAQKQEVLVFTYESTMFEKGRVVLQETLPAPNLTVIRTFEVGGNSFLAIGGDDPRIVKYDGYGFMEVTNLGSTFANVQTWMPINIHTYRDDLVILVESIKSFGTHNTHIVKALIWNGDTFDVSPLVPCHDEDDEPSQGLTCILDERRPEGLRGATYIQKKDRVAIVVPQKDAPSVLYKLFYEISPGSDPVIEDLKEIERTYEIVAEMVEYQDAVIADAIQAIYNAFNPASDAIVATMWEIDHLTAPEVYTKSEVTWENLNFGGKSWRPDDARIDLNTLEEYLTAAEQQLNSLEETVSTRNLRSHDSPEFRIPVQANGQFTGQYQHHGQNGTDEGYIRPPRQSGGTTRNFTRPPVLTLDYVEVDELEVERINGVLVSDLIFTTDNHITLMGKLVVFNALEVNDVNLGENGKVNRIDLDKDIIHFSPGYKPQMKKLIFDAVVVNNQTVIEETINTKSVHTEVVSASNDNGNEILSVERLVVKGNLDTNEINGIAWSDMMKNITPRNIPTRMDYLEVKGPVVVDHTNLEIINLNKFNFNDDFVFSDPRKNSSIKITGRKKFVRGLIADEVDCAAIDGVLPSSAITLTEHESILGTVAFNSLEVSDALEVNGQIEGEHLNKIQENLNLQQSRIINADVTFNKLQVHGPIKIKHTYNGANLDEVLGSVIYTDSPKIVVNSAKSFGTAHFEEGIHIETGMLNDFHVKDIVTRSTDQEVPLSVLNGDVMFLNLDLGGRFDGHNVTDLVMNSVKLYGDQYTHAELIFDNDESLLELAANNLIVESTLNNVGIDDFIRIDHEEELQGSVSFNELLSTHCDVFGNVQTSGLVNGIELKEFEQNRLSVTRPQSLNTLKVGRLMITGNLRNEQINSVETSSFTNDVLKSQSVRNLLFSGDIVIDNMHVTGNVGIKYINGRELNEVIESAVWLNKPNSLYGNLVFQSPVQVRGNLSAFGYVNDEVFNNFLKDLALRADQTYLRGAKVFANGFHVTGNIYTETLNGHALSNYVLKNEPCSMNGPLLIKGYVTCDHLNVNTMNNISMRYIKDIYYYDPDIDLHVIKSDVTYYEYMKIKHLVVKSSFNDIPNVNEFFASVIRVDRDYNISAPKTFLSTTYFDSGFNVATFNDENFADLMSEVVLVNSPDTVNINGLVRFSEVVHAPSANIKADLATHNIADCSPLEWSFNGLLTNRHENIMTSLTMDAENFGCSEVHTIELNGKPMDDIVTLNAPQNFDQVELKIKELHWQSPIRVGGNVNGFKLPATRENTLMNYGLSTAQHIACASTTFHSIRVLETLKIDNINGIPFDNIATINGHIQFHSPLEFTHVYTDAVQTEDFISGINFNHWYDSSLTSVRDHTIYPEWTIENLHLTSEVTGNGQINGIPVSELVQRLDGSHERSNEAMLGVSNEYRKICTEIKTLAEKTNEGIHYFKHFELAFTLKENTPINSAFAFKTHFYEKILINTGCESTIYKWDTTALVFQKTIVIKTGIVKQAISVEKDITESYLVVLSDHEDDQCQYRGLNTHKIENGIFTSYQHATEPPVITDIRSNSINPQTFYAICSDNKVREYDIHLREREEWLLPTEHGQYRFLPEDISGGIALSDGKHVVRISSMKRGKRDKVYAFPVQYYTMNPLEDYHDEENVDNIAEVQEIDGVMPRTRSESNFVDQIRHQVSKIREKTELLRKKLLTDQPNGSDIFRSDISPYEGSEAYPDQVTADFNHYQKQSVQSVDENAESKPAPEPSQHLEDNVKAFSDSKATEVEFNFRLKKLMSKLGDKLKRLQESSESMDEAEITRQLQKELFVTNERFYNLSLVDPSQFKDMTEIPPPRNKTAEREYIENLRPLLEKFDVKLRGLSGRETVAERQISVQLQIEIANMLRTLNEDVLQASQEKPISELQARVAELSVLVSLLDDKVTPVLPVQLKEEITKIIETAEHTESPLQSQSNAQYTKQLREEISRWNNLTNEVRKRVNQETGTQSTSSPIIPAVIKDGERVETTATNDTVKSTNPKMKCVEVTDPPPVSYPIRPPPLPQADYSSIDDFLNKMLPKEQTTESVMPETPTEVVVAKTVETVQAEEPTTHAATPKPVVQQSVASLLKEIPKKETVQSSGVNIADNSYLPEKGRGEIVVMNVGVYSEQRKLVAVLRKTEERSIIPGHLDSIKVYEDIHEGKLFQTIPCYQPSGLSVIHLRDETLLAFLEGKAGVRVYAYRGIQGFVLVTSFNLNKVATDMKAIKTPLTTERHRKCHIHYLSVISGNEILFYEARTEPERVCGVHADLNCD